MPPKISVALLQAQARVEALEAANRHLVRDLQAVVASIRRKDEAICHLTCSQTATHSKRLLLLGRLADLFADGLVAFALAPQRSVHPSPAQLDQYSEADFLAEATSAEYCEGHIGAEMDCSLGMYFVQVSLQRAALKAAEQKAQRTRNKEAAPVDPVREQFRFEKAQSQILQCFVDYVNPQYVSTASYLISLQVRCITKSKRAVDTLGRYLPGGQLTCSHQRHLEKLVNELDDSKLVLPPALTYIFGYDNNSDNYVNTHGRCSAVLKANDPQKVWTNRTLIAYQKKGKASTQFNPANSVTRMQME
ncbi:hypothetical protein B484DRAFT_390609 [Ochromonadaceae sp. CCMP2298]|nr:hypothetical protein B484DRAFT_390609 [Ochromonadaceae sp. CCMP2298]